MEMHKGTLIEQYLDKSHTRRLTIVARADGSFGYFEELRDVYFEAEDDYPTVEIWIVVQLSGIFLDLNAARTDALVVANWARNRETRRI